MLRQYNMMVNIIHNYKRVLSVVLVFFVIILLSSCEKSQTQSKEHNTLTQNYNTVDDNIYNPLIGFAPEADYEESVGDNTLVYIEVLWKDIEPQEGEYDFSVLEEKNHLDKWRNEGKHAVLRFMCDKPSPEKHMDIPEWLYKKTQDGTFYQYDDSHAGYSPDYNNTTFIAAHEKVIKELGRHFSTDNFVCYVELGSLGHWGEWHVNYDAGITRMPKAEIREKYVTPYIAAFKNAKFLMRRPFNTAADHNFGLYDDTAGNAVATDEWLKWIVRGGDYEQAEESNALTPMRDAWKIAPIGGEFNSDILMTTMLTSSLKTTLSLLEQSHTSFLGPNYPNGIGEKNGENCPVGIKSVQKKLGYRLYVEKSERETSEQSTNISLVWNNKGIAPIYWNWDAYFYFYDENNNVTAKYPIDINISEITPDKKVTTNTSIPSKYFNGVSCVAIGVEDPLTKAPAVQLAMNVKQINKTSVLWTE